MKILKFLRSNFQVLNFLIASFLVAICMGLWFNSTPQENQGTMTNDNEVGLEQLETVKISEQSISTNSKVETDSTSQENPSQKNSPVPTTVNSTVDINVPETSTLPALSPESQYSVEQNFVNVPTQTLPPLENQTYLGHFPFEETPSHRRVNVGKYYHRTEYLDQETAQAFAKMKADAKAQGVELVLMSGFRTIAAQEKLFNKQVQRRGSKEAAARLSAPPGHSEHHTGYAVDIGDGKQPEMDFKFEFEYTQAYRWLANNAYRYYFELSFPRDNLQGVSFEPWHWRYVGSSRAQQIFAIPRIYSYSQQN